MNTYQVNIIWLGLILIVLNLAVNLGEVKSVLFGTSSGTTASGQQVGQSTPAGNLV